jgi:hypothetical protein
MLVMEVKGGGAPYGVDDGADGGAMECRPGGAMAVGPDDKAVEDAS